MLLTPPPFENSDTTRTSPTLWASPVKSWCPLGAEQLSLPCRNQKPTSFVPLSLFFSSAKYMTLSPASAPPGMLVGTVYDAAYAFMMSILLLTLLSRLHCQPPPVMSSVSLLPVANVLE